MINTEYYHYSQCPLTDEDRAIQRDIVSRMGGRYYGIHQTEQGVANRRDEILTKSLVNGKRPQGWRRDSMGRLKTISQTHSDACYPFQIR